MSLQHLDRAPRTNIIEMKLVETRAGRKLKALGVIDSEGTMLTTPVYIRATRKKRKLVYIIKSVDDYNINMQYVDYYTRNRLPSYEYQQTQSSFWSNWTITLTTEEEWCKGSIA